MTRRAIILTAIWILAFLVALTLDSPIAQWIHDSGTGQFVEGKWWAQILKEPGQFRFTIVIAILLICLKQIRWKQAIFVMVAGAISGLHVLIKWSVGRHATVQIARTDPTAAV